MTRLSALLCRPPLIDPTATIESFLELTRSADNKEHSLHHAGTCLRRLCLRGGALLLAADEEAGSTTDEIETSVTRMLPSEAATASVATSLGGIAREGVIINNNVSEALCRESAEETLQQSLKPLWPCYQSLSFRMRSEWRRAVNFQHRPIHKPIIRIH